MSLPRFKAYKSPFTRLSCSTWNAFIWPLVPLVVSVLSGCSSAKQDALESKLRQQEITIRELQDQLSRGVTVRQASEVANESGEPGNDITLVSSHASKSGVQRIRIHSLTTGLIPRGFQTDTQPVAKDLHDAWLLNVVVQMIDQNHEITQSDLPNADLYIDLVDVSGGQKLVSRAFSRDEIRELWVNGLLADGVNVQIPVDHRLLVDSMNGKLLLNVRLNLVDGKSLSDAVLLDSPGSSVDQYQ